VKEKNLEQSIDGLVAEIDHSVEKKFGQSIETSVTAR
jgi:citrate lyase gamma subunit